VPQNFWFTAVALLSAGAVCAPYLLKVKQLLNQTADRSGGNYDYSTAHVFNWEDTLGSLVFPPSAQGEGWYFIGICGLLLIASYLVLTPWKPGAPSHERGLPRPFAFKAVVLVWFAVVTYITWGRESLLFGLLWRYLPGFNALRVWGRLNIILIPLLAWLLAVAYGNFEQRLRASATPPAVGRGKAAFWSFALCAALVMAAILGIQFALLATESFDPYWPAHFRGNVKPWLTANPDTMFIALGMVSFACLLALAWWAARGRARGRALAAMLAVVALSWIELYPVGSTQWSRPDRQPVPRRAFLGYAGHFKKRLGEVREWGESGLETLSPAGKDRVGLVESWFFSRYVNLVRHSEPERVNRNRLLGVSEPRRVWFSARIDYGTIGEFLQDADRFKGAALDVDSYDGDRLELTVDAPTVGYVSFIDNWDPDWRASLDGNDVAVQKLFGTFKSVEVTPGRHRVAFAYRPWVFWRR